MDLNRAYRFMKHDIWRIRTRDLPRSKSLLIRNIRILLLTIRGVTEDRCLLRASALTFYSVLSIVPIVAMLFGIAKGFGFENKISDFLTERFEGQERVIEQVVVFAQAQLENVKGGLVAGIGIALLFYAIIKILSHIESAFNDIWGVKKSRSFTRKITDYLSLFIISPVLFLISSTATVAIRSGAKIIIGKISLIGIFSPVIFSMLKFLPYCILWVLFSFLYIFIPNTRVRFRSGIIGGVIAGTTYEVFQWIYIHFQIVFAKYNAIYGSFAALPLFFIWLQVSWLIVLAGAEIAFAHQNESTYEFEQDCLNANQYIKRLLSLGMVHLLVRRFIKGEHAWTASQIAHKLEAPIRLIQDLLYGLSSSGILSETHSDSESEVAYQPAIDPDTITIKYILDVLERSGSQNIPYEHSKAFTDISESMREFSTLIEESPANLRLRDIEG